MGPTWVLSAPDEPHVGPHEPCYHGDSLTPLGNTLSIFKTFINVFLYLYILLFRGSVVWIMNQSNMKLWHYWYAPIGLRHLDGCRCSMRRQVISKSSWWLLMTWRLNTWHIWYCITCKVYPIKQHHVLMFVAWLWVFNGFVWFVYPHSTGLLRRYWSHCFCLFFVGASEAICKNMSKIDRYLSIKYISKHERCLYLLGCTILSNAWSDSSKTFMNLFHNWMLTYTVYKSIPKLNNCEFVKALIFLIYTAIKIVVLYRST